VPLAASRRNAKFFVIRDRQMDKDRERLKGIDNSVNIWSLYRVVYCVHSIDVADAIEVSVRQQ
jgi:hypothetical protein